MDPKQRESAGMVLVPIEGSSQELIVQEQAVNLAANLGVPLKAIHVSTEYEPLPRRFFSYVEGLAHRRQVPFEKRVIRGDDVVREILEEVTLSDIIVVGTRFLGSEYHLGSVTEALIHRAPCPVQVIRLGPVRPERRRPVVAARSRIHKRPTVARAEGWGADP